LQVTANTVLVRALKNENKNEFNDVGRQIGVTRGKKEDDEEKDEEEEEEEEEDDEEDNEEEKEEEEGEEDKRCFIRRHNISVTLLSQGSCCCSWKGTGVEKIINLFDTQYIKIVSQ
jgi:hypothetical protein